MSLFPLLLALTALAADEPVVIRVDAVEITASEVGRRLETFRARQLAPTGTQLADNLIEEVLFAAEAERLGLRKDAAVAARLASERRAVLASVISEQDLKASTEPPEAMLREMFHATGDFARFHLLTYASRSEAEAALARIEKGATFQLEARSALTARVAPQDGAAPLEMRAQIRPPEVVGPLFASRPGQVLGPIALSTGFALVRVVEIQLGPEEAFQARRAKIAEHARTQLAGQAKAHYVARLKDAAGVRLDEEFLSRLKGVEATPAEADHVIASVHGEPLRYRDVLPAVREVARSTGGHGMSGAVKLRVANQEIERRLLAREAEARGVADRPEVARRLRAAERSVLAMAVAERIARETPAPTAAEVRAFFDRNAKAYGRTFAQVEADAAGRAAAEKQSDAITARGAALRKKARVKVDEGALKRIREAAR